MADYVARSYPAKKLESLKKREQELLHEIRFGVESELLFRAAERLKDAQLGYLKGKRYYTLDLRPNPTAEGDHRRRLLHDSVENGLPLVADRLEKMDTDIKMWRSKTAEEIVDQYKKVSEAKPLAS